MARVGWYLSLVLKHLQGGRGGHFWGGIYVSQTLETGREH